MRTLTILTALLMMLAATGCDSPADDPEGDNGDAVQEGQQGDEQQQEDERADDTDGEPEAAEGEEPELADDLQAGQTRHYGESFTVDDDPISLTEALETIDGADEGEASAPLRVEADVQRVCQNKGCWFTLDAPDIDETVRVRMKNYGFLVPRNTQGAQTVIEGTIAQRTIDEELAQHYAEDVAAETDEDPEEVDGPQRTYRFTATGLSMTLPES